MGVVEYRPVIGSELVTKGGSEGRVGLDVAPGLIPQAVNPEDRSMRADDGGVVVGVVGVDAD